MKKVISISYHDRKSGGQLLIGFAVPQTKCDAVEAMHRHVREEYKYEGLNTLSHMHVYSNNTHVGWVYLHYADN